MKKALVSSFTAVLLVSGSFVTVNSSNTVQAAEKVVVTSSWVWYYTDYTLSDGWYEKWYRNGDRQKKETYNSNGKLVRTVYY